MLAGWGGVFPLVAGEVSFKSGRVRNISRVLAFKIGGTAKLPPLPATETPPLHPPPSTASADEIRRGEAVFQRFCSGCHGDVAVSGGLVPDLRYSAFLKSDRWFAIVRDGLLKSQGMVGFGKEVSQEDATAIRSYVIFRANQTLNEYNPTLKTWSTEDRDLSISVTSPFR